MVGRSSDGVAAATAATTKYKFLLLPRRLLSAASSHVSEELAQSWAGLTWAERRRASARAAGSARVLAGRRIIAAELHLGVALLEAVVREHRLLDALLLGQLRDRAEVLGAALELLPASLAL